MTAFTRLRVLAAGTLLMVAGAGVLAPAAFAGKPSLLITRPGDGQLITARSFAVDAEARMSNGVLVGKITVTVAPAPNSVSKQATQSGEFNTTGRDSEQKVSFPVQTEYNGKYLATVRATGRDNPSGLGLIEDDELETETAIRDFFVVAPPAPPTNVRTAIDKESRAVTLSWAANTEKDMLFYVVQRAKGDGAFSPLATTDGPGGTSIVDPSTAEAAGEYRYQVVAVRRGADASTGVNSDPSPAASATVPGPPASGTTVPGGTTAGTTPGSEAGTGGGSTPGNTTGSTLSPNSPGALRSSGTLDLSGFTAIQRQARRPDIRSNEPDPGFTDALPFGATNTTRLVGEDEQAVAPPGGTGEDGEVRELGAEDASNDRRRSAGFLAAGLLATVLLMHLLWIKGEVQREPLEALVPE
ncbi:MAG TPA: hypothetical protein VM142_12325 [Acidimicrobiales bacterium]|nr:hypothetical protein [Acidimicrobiales bacterium]